MKKLFLVLLTISLVSCKSEEQPQETNSEIIPLSEATLAEATTSIYQNDLGKLKKVLKTNPDLLDQWIYFENDKNSRHTLLQLAAWIYRPEIFSFLLDIGANYYKDWDASTSEFAARAKKGDAILKIIYDRGFELKVLGKWGFNALNFAVINDDPAAVEFLLNHGFSVNDIGVDRYPIHHAAASSTEKAIPILIKYGSDPNQNISQNQHTPLYEVLRRSFYADYTRAYNDKNTLKQLLSYGANPNFVINDNGWYSALHIMLDKYKKCQVSDNKVDLDCTNRLLAYIDLLLEAGADINAFIIKGPYERLCHTPLDSEYGSYFNFNPEKKLVLEYLIQKGAKFGRKITTNGVDSCILSDEPSRI